MNKKFLTLAIIIVASSIFADTMQQKHVHQYIVREAWKLLKTQYPVVENSDLASHIGNNEIGDAPWETALIVTGAYREDLEDPVYGYAGWNVFGLTDPILVTMTHFWNADLGDNHMWNFLGSDWENNYQKSKAYLYADHRIFIYKVSYAADYGQVILGRFIKYVNLFHLYNTGQYYNNGYIDLAGDVYYWESTELTTMEITTAQKYVYEILGRISHLLADTGTPAHAHNDPHPSPLGDADTYETDMGTLYENWTYLDALNAGGIFTNITQFNNALRFLLYTTNQIADHYPSDDRSGDNNFDASFNGDTYHELVDIMTNLGDVPTNINPSDIAENAFVYSIRSTATLLYWFGCETDMISPGTPSAPSNLTLSGSPGENPVLNWDANSECDVAEYWVYRDMGSGYIKIGTVNHSTTTYTDYGITIAVGGPYAYYKIKGVDVVTLESPFSNRVSTKYAIAQRLSVGEAIPEQFTLQPNSPNPFNPVTTLRYDLPEESQVSLTIYDLMGREIRSLANGRLRAGSRSLIWNGTDNHGNAVPSGVYIIRLEASSVETEKEFRVNRKMVLLR